MNKLLKRYEELGHSINPELITTEQSLRINTLKISEEECKHRLEDKGVHLKKIEGIPAAYTFSSPFPIVSSEEYLLGYIYLQETASMLPSLALLQHGEVTSILDMCAAPGSKTTQLAALTNNNIHIDALDITLPRLKKLELNLERLSVTAVTTYRKDARFAFDLEKEYSHVLLDAPCSGNFCIEPDFFEKRTPRDFKDRARLQKELLRAAYGVLADGGVLVYSTCSLEPEEDEAVVDWFLKEFSDMQIKDISLPLGEPGQTEAFGQSFSDDVQKTRKLWPEKTSTQGFFIACFQKEF